MAALDRVSVRVHLLQAVADEDLARLAAQLRPQVRLTAGARLPAPADFHILVAGTPTRVQLAASPRLHTLIIPWAGLPQATRALLADFPGLAVHNLHHNAAPVAEMAMALLLAAARAIVPFDRALRHGDWRPRYERPGPSVLLAGKTAVVLGYGAIGQRVARACHALEMQVAAVRRRLDAPVDEGHCVVYPVEQLPRLWSRANALLICLPLTPATASLVGAAELAQLPPRAVLVNIGRGPVVDEAALYAALREGRLHAAGLDVWYQYPEDEGARAHTPPASHPFHELDNVVLSPHRAGGSDATTGLRLAGLAAALNAAAQGQPLPYPVDVTAGY